MSKKHRKKSRRKRDLAYEELGVALREKVKASEESRPHRAFLAYTDEERARLWQVFRHHSVACQAVEWEMYNAAGCTLSPEDREEAIVEMQNSRFKLRELLGELIPI